jgi:hypothetical protein
MAEISFAIVPPASFLIFVIYGNAHAALNVKSRVKIHPSPGNTLLSFGAAGRVTHSVFHTFAYILNAFADCVGRIIYDTAISAARSVSGGGVINGTAVGAVHGASIARSTAFIRLTALSDSRASGSVTRSRAAACVVHCTAAGRIIVHCARRVRTCRICTGTAGILRIVGLAAAVFIAASRSQTKNQRQYTHHLIDFTTFHSDVSFSMHLPLFLHRSNMCISETKYACSGFQFL